MAWNEDGDGVFTDGGADGAGGFGVADGFGDACVGGGLAEWNFQELLPDFELEGGAVEVEGNLCCKWVRERLLRDGGVREFGLELGEEISFGLIDIYFT